jgi:diketogulonate reductase-like aldo/keto reductase
MIQFLKAGASTAKLSRLTLAVVTGLLQSLVEATPQRIGQTYLRWLYDWIHVFDSTAPKSTGTAFYFMRVELSDAEWLDLEWWETFLQSP